MMHKTQRHQTSLVRAATTVKNWTVGWTVSEARTAADRWSRHAVPRRAAPGAYGLLAGASDMLRRR